jgi:hypothetical protein
MGGRDPLSPPLSRSNTLDGGSGEGGAGYSTYQPRRNKPSLEDRLRASLAAKEQKRVISERESAAGMGAGLGMPTVGEERAVSSPVPNGPATIPGQQVNEIRTQGMDGEEERARNIALPSSPPLQNAPPFLSQVLRDGEVPKSSREASAVTVEVIGELPRVFNDDQAQINHAVPPPATKEALPETPSQEPQARERQEELPIATPAPVPDPETPTQIPDHTALPPIPPVQEKAEPLQTRFNADQDPKTITPPPPPPPSKYDDPLTPAFLELEQERQAAATKARLSRSPPPKSQPKHPQSQLQSQPGSPQSPSTYSGTAPIPDPLSSFPNPLSLATTVPPTPSSAALSASPTKKQQQFAHGRSRSMAPEGEPFIRFGGSSSGSTSFSLEQVLRKPGVLEGLGLESVRDEEGLRAWVEGVKLKVAVSTLTLT